MKKYIVCSLLLLCSLGQFSCKKFLDVTPLDKLTGNNFYKNKEDVETVIYDMSRNFFTKINATHYAGAVGEYRAGEVKHQLNTSMAPARRFVEVLGKNDLLQLLYGNPMPWDFYNFGTLTDWTTYYRVIQSANILVFNLEQGIPTLSDKQTKQYIGEAKFIRCLAYFYLVRLYGDVPYYTKAFYSDAPPRENMVSVFNKCIVDLKGSVNDMQWTFSDPALRGVRASKGSVIALLMNMNMWNAGFDGANASKYWEETARLGDELIKSGAYKLLNLKDWNLVMKGRSDESLFEFYRSINYNDAVNNFASIGDMFLHYPYKRPQTSFQVSFAYFKAEYMKQIYPEIESDKRKEAWFENMYANDGDFIMQKYGQNVYASGNQDVNPDNTFLVFRYAESILLCAEAQANLGHNAEATTLVNMVRERAEAAPYDGSGSVKDFVFLERSRELIGEGHHYFDLIRTKRILSRSWTSNPLTLDQFNRGGWTWPINEEARNNNPYMTLNTYWLTGGK